MSLASTLLGPHSGLLIGLVVGVANFLTVLSVMRALSPKDMLAARARDHARRRSELRAARLALRRSPGAQPLTLAKRLLAGLKLDRGEEARKVSDQLAQAGWRTRDAVALFLTFRLAGPLLVGALAWLLAPAILHIHADLQRMLATAGGIAIGAYLPTLLLRNVIERRRTKIQRALPDALDLFVICAEAGLSLDAAVTRVAREMGAGAPELADELGLTAIELGFLPDRRDALLNLVRRVGSGDVRGLVNTLVQTEKYGTPLAQSLRVLASEFRDTRLMKAEEKAARLPATLTVPMIAFILPPLFVILLGPAILQFLAVGWR
ncbi:MAG: type II secretion system F family protein [Alphaproteobacteria bacterium]|nr:type II secretion system F family protein [Alphaproteobacteria bacterium]